MEKGIESEEEIILLSSDNPALKMVQKRYGKLHKIEAILGTNVILEDLDDNQSVCYGDGKHYHFKLTKL